MTYKKDSPKKEGKKGQTTTVMLSMTEADLQRLKKLFDEGKLKELGITGMEISPIPETEPAQKRWGVAERRKRAKPSNDELPPH